jgi:anti-sigma regulatory factor (Ser/Thr protein kinase)
MPRGCKLDHPVFTDLIALARFIFDPSTRRDLRMVARASGYGKLRWRKLIKTARAKFSADRAYEVTVFAHLLEEDLRAITIDKGVFTRFQVVFAELVDNAFRHGTHESGKHVVRIRCDYAEWFIRLQVTDSGKGFHLNPDTTSSDGGAHGLDIAARLSSSLRSNPRGNSITAIVLPRRELTVAPAVESVDGAEILVLTISNSTEWHYLITDWEPLRRVLTVAPQRLVLINSYYMRWSSQEFGVALPKIIPFLDKPEYYFAFVVDLDTLGAFDLRALRRINSRVFGRLELQEAMSWLAASARKGTTALRDISM